MPETVPPDECANCGATIPRGARACPACGADERTGWRDSSVHDGLDLPQPGYGDDGPPPPDTSLPRVNGLQWYWYIVAALLLALLVMGGLSLR